MWYCDKLTETTILFSQEFGLHNNPTKIIGTLNNNIYLLYSVFQHNIINIWNFSDKFECKKNTFKINNI